MTLTLQQIEEIKAGCDGVTRGPWQALRSDQAEGVNCWWVNTRPSTRLRGFTSTVATVDGGYGLNDNREIAAHIARMDPDTVHELCRLAMIGAEREARAAFIREQIAKHFPEKGA